MIEELVDRVLLIGIPLYLIHNYGTRKNRNRPDPNRPEDIYPVPGRRPDLPRHDVDNKGLLSLFTSLFRKENRKYFLGGGLELNTQAVLLLFISSMVFSISHIGWDWTKLIPTFLGGMILGVLFLRKGLHACILLHFAINSFSISYLVAGEPMVLEVVLYSICFGSIPFGAYYLYFYLRFFRRKLSRINLDFRSVEFSKAVTATGGVVLLLFVLFGLFFLGMFALEDDSEEHTEHRYFQLSEGDYCIVRAGGFEKGEGLNGSLVLTGKTGEMELFVSNKTQKEGWKESGGEVDTNEFLLYLHIKIDPTRGSGRNEGDRNSDTSDEEKLFTLTFEDPETVYFILHAKKDSRCYFNYTTNTKSSGGPDIVIFSVCCGPLILLLTAFGLGCIYTSNHYGFSKRKGAVRGYPPPYQPPLPYRYDPYGGEYPPSYPPPPQYPPPSSQFPLPQYPPPSSSRCSPPPPQYYPPPPSDPYYQQIPPPQYPYYQQAPPSQHPPSPSRYPPPLPSQHQQPPRYPPPQRPPPEYARKYYDVPSRSRGNGYTGEDEENGREKEQGGEDG